MEALTIAILFDLGGFLVLVFIGWRKVRRKAR